MVTVGFEKFGELLVDGKVYYSDMIVWWDGEVEFVPKDHILDMGMFSRLLRKKPYMVVIGTGEQECVLVSDEVRRAAKAKGIKLFEDDTGCAAEIFNCLVSNKKKAVALFHVTS